MWYITNDKKLSRKAKDILSKAESSEKVLAIIPTIVLAEITHIGERKRIPFKIEEIISIIESSPGFFIAPFDELILKKMLELPSNIELHDRIITATALFYNSKLVTKDSVITGSFTSVIW